MLEKNSLQTEYRTQKEARELAIYNDWCELTRQPGAMATAVNRLLCEKYGIHAPSTIWFIRKRVSKRLGLDQTCEVQAGGKREEFNLLYNV